MLSAAARRTDGGDSKTTLLGDRSMTVMTKRSPGFAYAPMFPLETDDTQWRKLDIAGVSTIEVEGKTVLKVTADALSELAFSAFRDIAHLLRPAHLAQLSKILKDPEA